jgi:hypothetical protein
MLEKWPNPNKLSEMSAWAIGLWIRRVLVRAQEGQTEDAIGAWLRSRLFVSAGRGRFLPPSEAQLHTFS